MSADTFHKLKALGLSLEQIGSVLEIIEEREKPFIEADAARKANARERVNKWRSKQPVTLHEHNRDITETAHASASPAPDLENKQTNKEDKKTRTPRDELAVVLDADRVDAVIEHRIKLRKPLTAYAARQLAASFASCPDANAAADLMIESGWLKIKPGWIEGRSAQRSHAPPERTMDDALDDFVNGKPHDEHSGPTIDAGYSRTDFGSAQGVVSFDAFAARQRS